jgi:hypothetical protein
MATDMDSEADTLQELLQKRGLNHLRVHKRGKALILNSGPEDDPEPEARLTSLERGQWRLDMRHHSGKWEQTPFTGSLDELLESALSIGGLEDLG